MNPKLESLAQLLKGWLSPLEGATLYRLAWEAPAPVIVEIGSYCGKSTVYLGAAAQDTGKHVWAVDPHTGSEEHVLDDGSSFDPELTVDGRHNTFVRFRAAMLVAGMEDTVTPVVKFSADAAADWSLPIGLVFIDGAHDYENVKLDASLWAPHVVPGGFMAFHDAYGNHTAPTQVANESVEWGFEDYGQFQSLRVVRRSG